MNKASQAVFAACLDTSPSLKLLDIVNQKGVSTRSAEPSFCKTAHKQHGSEANCGCLPSLPVVESEATADAPRGGVSSGAA